MSVSLSSNGNVVAIGDNDCVGDKRKGRAQIFRKKINSWERIGSVFYGEANMTSISLSTNGSLVAFGSKNTDTWVLGVYVI